MHTTPRPTARPADILERRSEQAALDELADRLARRFPHASAEQITRAIRTRHDSFQSSPIRDFIPLLVERAVSADLTNLRDLADLNASPTAR